MATYTESKAIKKFTPTNFFQDSNFYNKADDISSDISTYYLENNLKEHFQNSLSGYKYSVTTVTVLPKKLIRLEMLALYFSIVTIVAH